MPVNRIRNIAFIGQTGTGKTSLIERLLFEAKAIKSLGSIEKGDTVTDFDPQSIQYQHSIEATPVTLSWNNHRMNYIDTPGQAELLGRSFSVLPAVESTALVVDADTPLNQVSDRLFAFAREQQKCQMIIVNKIDETPQKLQSIMQDISEHFGDCLPAYQPTVGGWIHGCGLLL